jgi:hypothetical protein
MEITTSSQSVHIITVQPPDPQALRDWIIQQGQFGPCADELLQAAMLFPPTPIPIPPEGVPESARSSEDECWWGTFYKKRWSWIFIPCRLHYQEQLNSTHYLPHDVVSLPTKASLTT